MSRTRCRVSVKHQETHQAMMIPSRRCRLTWEQKNLVAREWVRHGTRNTGDELMDIAKWTKQKFNLPILPSRFTMSRIIHTTASIEEKAGSIGKYRKNKWIRGASFIEETLHEWIHQMYNKQICTGCSKKTATFQMAFTFVEYDFFRKLFLIEIEKT